ncbi:MAG TPA: D-aminoacylase [Burkholderiales bacterium]|jgi:N-acyl-D-amino-acid deacylase|nr:D-aminoacylase [Burkholderiales bacterium]
MSEHYDLIIRNGTLIDGVRTPRYAGDLAIKDGRIARLGKLDGARADSEIDASGKIVAPGFIDSHTHDDRLLTLAPEMTPKLSQGVTTVIAGNCGISLAPLVHASPPSPLDLIDDGNAYHFKNFAEFMQARDAVPAAINAAFLVGHTTLRVAVMDQLDRAATPAEAARMAELSEEAMAAGAIGLSTGAYYPPAAASSTEEIIAVARPLARHGGRYVTHMRHEDEEIIPAMEEAFRIGREAGVPVIISHHKVVGTPNFGRSVETLALLQKAQATQQVCIDCYPYVASSTMLRADRIDSASRIIVTWSKPLPQYTGRDLVDVAREMGVSQEEAVARLRPAGGIYFSMDEADVQRILKFEDTMVGSDGLPHDVKPHPRLWGTFPRVLGHYSRDVGLFPLETAVYKMTGLTAQKFGLKDRGRLAEGCFADVTIFDAATIGDAATFTEPTAQARGIDTVIVGGVPAWRGGKATGARTGKVLRGGA